MIIEHAILRFETPLGIAEIRGTEAGVSGIRFTEDNGTTSSVDIPMPMTACMRQLREYFAGERTAFAELPLVLHATDFQQKIWDCAMEIPYGETMEYAALAEAACRPGAARAVGTALGDNPLLILVPCHRIVPASGGIGQYAAGSARKEWLLALENRMKR